MPDPSVKQPPPVSDNIRLSLAPADNIRLANLCGEMDGNIIHIARALSVRIKRRGERFQLSGGAADAAARTIKTLYQQADKEIDKNAIRLQLAKHLPDEEDFSVVPATNGGGGDEKRRYKKLRNAAQQQFWDKIERHTVTLCTGPAGTGKTHVALAAALTLLHESRHSAETAWRLILTRPVIEAGGERLGFLPGDMEQKVNPYLRPLHDILYQLLGRPETERRIAQGEIEVIPLAFMRGLTLNRAIVIIDEAQNTTPPQIKMLLSRLGEEAKILIVGDMTQNDLPSNASCGLTDAVGRLKTVRGITHHTFSEEDIVRHPLVRDILLAYRDV